MTAVDVVGIAETNVITLRVSDAVGRITFAG